MDEFKPTLVLNADYQPLNYYPLSLWGWRDTVRAIFLDRVNILAEYEDQIIRSPSIELKLPSVVSLKDYVVYTKTVPLFSRFNVYLRDNFTCQYCNKKFQPHQLTFDHVLPRSKGGVSNWQNVVAACQKCNRKKGNKTLDKTDLVLYKQPRQPTIWELMANGKKFPPNYLHESWHDYLYWDSELESYE